MPCLRKQFAQSGYCSPDPCVGFTGIQSSLGQALSLRTRAVGGEGEQEGETRTRQGTCNEKEFPMTTLATAPPRTEDLEGAGRAVSVSLYIAWTCVWYVCWYTQCLQVCVCFLYTHTCV